MRKLTLKEMQAVCKNAHGGRVVRICAPILGCRDVTIPDRPPAPKPVPAPCSGPYC